MLELYLSVNVFSTKALIEDTIFVSPTGDGRDCHFTRSSKPLEGLAVCRANAEPSFLNCFKTLSIDLAARIQPVTCRIGDKFFTDWASPSTDICNKSQVLFLTLKEYCNPVLPLLATFCFILFQFSVYHLLAEVKIGKLAYPKHNMFQFTSKVP